MSNYEVKVRVKCAACDLAAEFWATPRVETRYASNAPGDDSTENHVEFDPPHPAGWAEERTGHGWPSTEMRCLAHRTTFGGG